MEEIPLEDPIPITKKIFAIFIVVLIIFLAGTAGFCVRKFLKRETTLSKNPFVSDILTTQGNSILAFNNPRTPSVAKEVKMIITAYSSTPWETDDTPFITASGERVRPGIVANNLLPLGTKIRIPEIYGDRIFVVKDRMNKKKSYYHIDIWLPSYWEAKSFGVKKAYVEILSD